MSISTNQVFLVMHINVAISAPALEPCHINLSLRRNTVWLLNYYRTSTTRTETHAQYLMTVLKSNKGKGK